MTRVLLVDDSEDSLYLLRVELEAQGYTVDVATNATVAFETAKKNRPDVIVSDVQMPDVNGIEFIRRIRGIPKLANVPAIALTGYSLEKEVRAALASGFTAYLTKPVDPAELLRRIEQVVSVRLRHQAG